MQKNTDNENLLIEDLDTASKDYFMDYAAAVIKSRALPMAEDGLKPVARRILYAMYTSGYTYDKKFVKSAKIVGEVMGNYHPHGDSSIYGALVRLGQWWSLRYPLITAHGNFGNILGDGAAAQRYTEAKLSPVGQMMLDEIKKNCVDFRPNYDNTTTEPLVLPSRFPFLLCGNNMGIAVGMSGDMVSHNFTEVMQGINYYLDNKETCTVADLMKFIKGPDFPTKGKIVNGDELLEIYEKGQGAVRIEPHYDIIKKGTSTQLVFHDIPYGVSIDGGVKEPLKRLVLEDGHEEFSNIDVVKVGERSFDIIVTLSKGADVRACLDTLFTKTRLASTVKINNTVIIDGNPKCLSLLDMIKYWTNYRSGIIKKVATDEYGKTNHKLTVTIGLQKCMSDIDKLVSLIRNSASREAAKIAIKSAFELSDEQADAVLDMKLSKLSRLDLEELNKTADNLTAQLARLKRTIEEDSVRDQIIKDDLAEIKKFLGEDSRLTEIVGSPVTLDKVAAKQSRFIYPEGIRAVDSTADTDLVDIVSAYGTKDIYVFNGEGKVAPLKKGLTAIKGAFTLKTGDTKLVTVSANGLIKVTALNEIDLSRSMLAAKVKDDDSMILAATCSDSDFVIISGPEGIAKFAISELTLSGRMTMGLKSGLTTISNAFVANENDLSLFATSQGKGKFVYVKDIPLIKRGNKVKENDGWDFIRYYDSTRTSLYMLANGKVIEVASSKLSIKSFNAGGATFSTKKIDWVK